MTANKTRKPIVKHDEEMSRDGISKLEELILQFLEYLEIEKGASKYTIRNYHLYLRRFSDWFFNEEKSRDIRKLDLNHVRKFRLFLSRYSYGKGRTLEKVTQSYYVIALRSFLKWLTKRDYEVISAENIDLPKTESRRIEFLTRSQVERLLNQPRISTKNGLRDKAILETLFSTGLRVSELINLNREHIDLERREFGVRGKGGRSRVVFLSKRAAGWIERYLSIREDKWLPLFIRYSGKKDDPNSKGVDMRLSVRSVQRMVVHYCKQAKLPIQITPHGLRHSFATDLLHSGAGLREVQEMLGHKNVSTTQIYTHVTNPQLRKVHDRYHSGNR